jgi:hypothetical protein
MFEKMAREILKSRSEIDPELRDWIGNESDFLTSSSETVNLDYTPGQFDHVLSRAVSITMENATTADLLQEVFGWSREEAANIAYEPVTKAHETQRQKRIDTSKHRDAVNAMLRDAFGDDLGLKKRTRAEWLDVRNKLYIPIIDSMVAFVEDAVADAR